MPGKAMFYVDDLFMVVQGVRANTVAFGYIETRLTRPADESSFITTADGETVVLGLQQKALADLKRGNSRPFEDIPLGRPGTGMSTYAPQTPTLTSLTHRAATEAASSILAAASPLFSYISGQTIEVTGGRQI